jgi:hypothetical protein
MSWLKHYRQRNDTNLQETLFDKSEIILDSKEPSRAQAQKDLQAEVKGRGGNAQTHMDVNRTVGSNMLGQPVNEVCGELGVKDRSKLPIQAKEALQMGDVAAREQMIKDNAQGHKEIVESADKGSKKARRLYSW